MKVKLEYLKKAIAWVEANSKDISVNIEFDTFSGCFIIHTFDRKDRAVKIKIRDCDSGVIPTVIAEEELL